MFFLIFYYYCFYVVGVFYVIQEMRKAKKAISFLDGFCDEDDDEDDDADDDNKDDNKDDNLDDELLLEDIGSELSEDSYDYN